MKITLSLKQILIVLAVLAVCIWIIISKVTHNATIESNALKTELWDAKAEVSTYEITVGELTEKVYESDVVILSKDDEIFKLTEQRDRLDALNIKNVNLIGELQAKIEVIVNQVPSSDTVIIIKEKDGVYVKLPLEYTSSDNYSYMNTKVGINGLADMRFGVSNLNFNIIVGDKSLGLFKASEPTFSITTDNPYVNIDQTKAILVHEKINPWWYVAGGSAVTIGAVVLLNAILIN